MIKTNNNGNNTITFKKIGLLLTLVVLGYMSCVVLAVGPTVLIWVDNGFFDESTDKVVYISASIKKHPAMAILGYTTAYTFLWGNMLVIVWVLQDIQLFLIACFNLVMFNGVTAYLELDGPEHAVFVVLLTLSHAILHHNISRSEIAKHFIWYGRLNLFANIILAIYIVTWFVADIIVKTYDVQVLALCFEWFVWTLAAFELSCMVSILHGSEFVTERINDTTRVQLLQQPKSQTQEETTTPLLLLQTPLKSFPKQNAQQTQRKRNHHSFFPYYSKEDMVTQQPESTETTYWQT